MAKKDTYSVQKPHAVFASLFFALGLLEDRTMLLKWLSGGLMSKIAERPWPAACSKSSVANLLVRNVVKTFRWEVFCFGEPCVL